MIVYIIVVIISAFLGRYIAKKKGRSASEGFLFGLILGLIGVIIVALLPAKKQEQTKDIEVKPPTKKLSKLQKHQIEIQGFWELCLQSYSLF